MTKEEQRIKAEEFLALHAAPELLILANVWDVSSARIYELEGFKAVGTTSAGIAATLGYPDGQRMSLKDTTEIVHRIAHHVKVPVSADIEAGYATSADGVADAARTVLRAGAVGVNLEGSTGDPSAPLYDTALQVEKISAILAMAASEEIPLVINARTDVYLLPDEDSTARFDRTIQRAAAYRQAGADCIFVPDIGQLDRETIQRLVAAIDAPLNIVGGEGIPPLGELEEIGVARVSFGPRAMRAAMALIRKIAREWLQTGTYSSMLAESMSYSEVNRMFESDEGACC